MKLKRYFDLLVSLLGLFILSPFLIIVIFLIWRQDYKSPFYIAKRTGLDGNTFQMIKLRSMIIDAEKSGVESTANDDNRITKIGHFIRRYKLDELSQLWNVLLGDMSLVGPRPNTLIGVSIYSQKEKTLLTVRPGITDFASIIFSDEGTILAGSKDPDRDYNQLIRPWKSKLGLVYIEKRSFFVDLKIIMLTIVAIFSKKLALTLIVRLLTKLNVNEDVINISMRDKPLEHCEPLF